MAMTLSSGGQREFNPESEQLAADRRARVAAAVNQQEWLDKQEVKWIPKKYRQNIRHGEDGAEEEMDDLHIEEGEPGSELDYMKVPAPIDDPQDTYKELGKKYGYHWAVAIFSLIFLGSIYFFWDSMHSHVDPHKPGMTQVEGQDMAEDENPMTKAFN